MDVADHESLYALAIEQQSLFTTAQAALCGISRKVLTAWARSRRIVPVHVGVWGLNGVAASPERSAYAALLAHGPQHSPALCRQSAAWAWEIPGHRLAPIRLLRARGEHHPSMGTAHTSRALDERDLTVRRGLPVTTPTRTIFDLAGAQHPARTRRDLNDLASRGLVSLELLDDALARLARRGRPGITTMRKIIEELREHGAPAESNLELRVEELFPLAGLRGMRRQVVIGDEGGVIARVDFANLELGLVIEVDSDRFHHGLIDRQIDAAKTARLVALGLTVIRITEQEVWHDRPALIARLRHAVRECRARQAA